MRNIHSLTLLVLSLCISNLNGQQVFFVKENGQGNGSSWRDAAGNLQAVLNKSNFGDQIWVAKGTYFPEGPHRESCFEIKDGVQLLGGFGGSEDNAAKRNPAVFKTILSGEIGKPGNLDNCYNVILTRHVSENHGRQCRWGRTKCKPAKMRRRLVQRRLKRRFESDGGQLHFY